MKKLTADYQKDRHKFMRNPVVAEFLGFSAESAYSETNLETAMKEIFEQQTGKKSDLQHLAFSALSAF